MSNAVDRLRGVRSSMAIKVPCLVATTTAITHAGLQTIDGVTLVDGDRVLDRHGGVEAGIWIASTGPWRRAADWDGVGDIVKGTTVRVTSGTINQGQWTVATANPITIGTTSVTFEYADALTSFLPYEGFPTISAQSKWRQEINAKREFASNIEDVIEAATALGTKKIVMEADNYEFDETFTIPAGTMIQSEKGAMLVPTFQQASGIARDTALVTLATGAQANRLEVYQEAGIDEVSIALQVGEDCRVGLARVTSAGYNNNIPAATNDFHTYAAVLVRGDNALVDQVETDFCRVGLRIYGCDNPKVGHIKVRRASLGLNPRDVSGLYLGSWDIEAVAYADQTREWNSNGLLTGENNILISGLQDSYIGPGRGTNSLEHAVRIGAGVERANNRIEFGHLSLIAPYGCGFKADDADAHTTTDIRLPNGVYVEDAGRDLEPGVTADWGNKDAVAIRNVERFYINGVTTRARNYTYCGEHGLWIEKSSRGNAFAMDTESARYDGLRLSPNGVAMLDVTVRGRTAKNGRDGVALVAVDDTDSYNRVDVDVSSFGNVANGYRVDDRPDTTAAFAGAVHLKGFGRGNATHSTIGAASAASANFFDETWSRANKMFLVGTATYNPASIAAGALGATTTVTVTGAALGDIVVISGPGASAGITWQGAVSSANTVTCYPINPTASPVDPASGTLTAKVFKL